MITRTGSAVDGSLGAGILVRDRVKVADVMCYRTKNMFSVSAREVHAKRRRLLGSSYSKSAVNRPRVQNIIKSRIGIFMNYIKNQASRDGSPVIVRNVTRPLEADIYTAFAFSENEGTDFLKCLTSGANTVDDTGMEQIDLFHDERRETWWFWESEVPSLFRYVFPYVTKGGQRMHAKAEKWISDLMSHYEDGVKTSKDKSDSTYGRMFAWRDVETGRPLTRAERASEIMDDCRELRIPSDGKIDVNADARFQSPDTILFQLLWSSWCVRSANIQQSRPNFISSSSRLFLPQQRSVQWQ